MEWTNWTQAGQATGKQKPLCPRPHRHESFPEDNLTDFGDFESPFSYIIWSDLNLYLATGDEDLLGRTVQTY